MSDEIKPKKRAKPEEWKDNKRKKLRACGEELVNRKGKVIPARKKGDKCRCKRRCLYIFSSSITSRILSNFNKLGNKVAQDAYLQNLIKVSPIKNSKTEATRHNLQNYSYEIHIGEIRQRVCREGFASLHGIGVKRVRRLGTLKAQGRLPEDRRGCHDSRPHKKSDELVAQIKSHIESFPYKLCHYGKTGSKKRYLPSILDIMKMFTLFLQKCYPTEYQAIIDNNIDMKKVNSPCSYQYYRKIYQDNYNYAFGKPRTDICSKCTELEALIEKENFSATRTAQLKAQLDCHKKKAAVFYDSLDSAQSLSESDESVELLCFDFKQNIACPHLNVGEVFYSRQLWLHVMSVYSGKKAKSIMYCWPESEGKKGANEVASVIQHYIEAFVPHSVKSLVVVTDGCRGQNVNITMMRFWESLVLTGRFKSVCYFLPERGHSYLPCDRHFAIIEKMQRKRETVELPEDWINIISSRFKVVELKSNMIKDYTKHFEKYFIKPQTVKAENDKRVKFNVTKFKKFKFHVNKIDAYQTLNEWNHYIFPNMLKKNITQISFEDILHPYGSSLPIKAGKLNDILKLIPFLKKHKSVNYYENLKGNLNDNEDSSDDE